MIQGFAVLAELCAEIVESGNNEYERSQNELPRYYGRTEIELFPFLHKVLVLDLIKSDYEQVMGVLRDITAMLEGSRICDLRNRLEHRRTDFPNQKEITTACSTLTNVITRMEVSGIYPLVYLYSGRTGDLYGRGVILLRDYKGREIKIHHPSQLGACGLPSINAPLIVCPLMHIGGTSELLRFQLVEASEYVKMWEGYPRRRRAYPGWAGKFE